MSIFRYCKSRNTVLKSSFIVLAPLHFLVSLHLCFFLVNPHLTVAGNKGVWHMQIAPSSFFFMEDCSNFTCPNRFLLPSTGLIVHTEKREGFQVECKGYNIMPQFKSMYRQILQHLFQASSSISIRHAKEIGR